MKQTVYKTCDVLIVGSGLAGLRAGISALSQRRDLKVCVATQGRGPSGSSFTNPNNALGLMVCHTLYEKEAFFKTALDIAPPGIVFPELVTILAEESEFIHHDLVHTGLSFNKDLDKYTRYPACFLNDPPMAYVFGGLSSAFLLLNKRFFAMGGETFEGQSLLDLVTNEEGRVIGALFEESETGRICAVHCQALIMATGGAVGLFPRSLTDPGNIGVPLSLMHGAGARLVNMNYIQYIWYRHDPWEPWPCWSMNKGRVVVTDTRGKDMEIPESIHSLLKERKTHVPVSHGRPDAMVDAFLCDMADSTGDTLLRFAGEAPIRVGLYAHALNGGALIDASARTNVPGLFACGECAGGMHGANRIGGAMVLSSQVFGHRAGAAAARFAHDPDQESRRGFMERVSYLKSLDVFDAAERKKGLDHLKDVLRGNQGPFPRPGIEKRMNAISCMLDQARDCRLKKALACARMLLK